MQNLVRQNTREHKGILRALSHTTEIEKKACMVIANQLNKLTPKEAEGYKERQELFAIEIPMFEASDIINANYSSIKNMCKKIVKRTIELKIEYKLKNGKTATYDSIECIFPSAGIFKNILKIKVNPDLVPLFNRELERYRHYNIIEAKFLSHQYSIEFYKFLKDKLNQNINEFSISVENLKFELGLEEKYKLYGHLKNRLLETVRLDLKQNSSLYFEYKEIKKNRAVSDLFIIIKTSEENEKNIYLLEKIKTYIKITTEEQFKKDFEIFIMRSYYDEDDRNKHLEPLKTKKSLKEFSEKIQLKFINFLEPVR